MRCHHCLRTWTATEPKTNTDARVAEEVFWPPLDRTTPAGRVEKAKIDVVIQDLLSTHLLDIAVAAVATQDIREMNRRMYEPGRPARLMAKKKFDRYGACVTPIIIEDIGRLHHLALRMFRRLAKHALDPVLEQRQLIGEYQAIMFTASMQAQRAARGQARA